MSWQILDVIDLDSQPDEPVQYRKNFVVGHRGDLFLVFRAVTPPKLGGAWLNVRALYRGAVAWQDSFSAYFLPSLANDTKNFGQLAPHTVDRAAYAATDYTFADVWGQKPWADPIALCKNLTYRWRNGQFDSFWAYPIPIPAAHDQLNLEVIYDFSTSGDDKLILAVHVDGLQF